MRLLRLAEADGKLGAWRKDYYEVRPHSEIAHKAQIALTNRGGATRPEFLIDAENSTAW